MTHTGDKFEIGNKELFALEHIPDAEVLKGVLDQTTAPVEGDDDLDSDVDYEMDPVLGTEQETEKKEENGEEDEEKEALDILDEQLENLYVDYLAKKKTRLKRRLVEKSPLEEAFLTKLEADMEKLKPKEDNPQLKSDTTNPLIYKYGLTKDDVAKMWFDNNIFKNLDLDVTEEIKEDPRVLDYNSDSDEDEEKGKDYRIQDKSEEKRESDEPPAKKGRYELRLSNSGALATDVKAEVEVHKNKEKKREKEEGEKNEKDGDDESEDEDDLEQKVEALAIGTMLIRKKSRRNLEDRMFNRFTFNDTDLPVWFEDDEKKHSQQELPLTKDAVEAIRRRWKEINSRPIKKVAEARARKKLKVARRVAKAKETALNIVKDQNLTNGQKISMAQKALKKADTKKKEKVYLVNKKGKENAPSVKGKYRKGARVKVVDPRMKKDIRAAKNREKTKKRGMKKVSGKRVPKKGKPSKQSKSSSKSSKPSKK